MRVAGGDRAVQVTVVGVTVVHETGVQVTPPVELSPELTGVACGVQCNVERARETTAAARCRDGGWARRSAGRGAPCVKVACGAQSRLERLGTRAGSARP